MADAFETKLAAMFDEAPELADTSDFLIGLDAKIERARARRRTVGLALAGAGAVAVSAGLVVTNVSSGFAELLATAGTRVGALVPWSLSPLVQTEIGWSILGVALLGAALGLNRMLEEG